LIECGDDGERRDDIGKKLGPTLASEVRKRKRRVYLASLVLLPGAALALHYSEPMTEWINLIVFLLFALLLACWGAFYLANWRCPRCERFFSTSWWPTTCPKCGVKFFR